MDCSKDSPGDESSSADIDNVETLIKSLYIERKNNKQSRNSQTKNPFKLKFIKKQKRKLSICYSLSQCKDILVNLNTSKKSPKDKESIVLLKISDKMVKTWNEDGYRESKPPLSFVKNKTTNGSKEQYAPTAENSNTENSENHSQMSSQTCARQAMYDYCDSSVTELAAYLDETLFIPRKMSFMAEMMYT